jgi:hypothetical protein
MPEEPEDEIVPINIGNINNGAALDLFAQALDKVLENIADLATEATATRRIVLTVEFKPHSDRIKVETEMGIACKLATPERNKSHVFLARSDGGGIVALDADPRQMPLWTAPKAPEMPVIEFRNGNK